MTHAEIHQAATETHKHCSNCGEFKALDDFPLSGRGFKGRLSWCRSCVAAYRSEYDKRESARAWRHGYLRRDHVRRYTRGRLVLTLYGEAALPLEERRLAGDGCDVCGSTDRVCIDHCHDTGALRGLLCKPCNQALGFAGDDPARLRALAAYLERAISSRSDSSDRAV